MILYKTKESKVVRVDEDCSDEDKVSNQTVAFTEADTRSNIQSGETFSTILGKIKRFFTDITTVAFTGNYNDLSDKPDIPAAVAVKGNAEAAYRTGNVNITPENIGLGNVNNTADNDKSVLKAIQDGNGNAIHETYATKNEVSAETDALKKSVSDGKTLVANAITAKGITTATNAAFQTMASNISQISTGANVSGVTAAAKDVVKGKKIVDANGNTVTGTLPNRSYVAGGASGVVGLEAGSLAGVAVSPYETAYHWRTNTDGVKRFCIRPPWGVYGGKGASTGNGDGYVGCPVSMFGNATQSQVLSGSKFTSQNGLAVGGTMTNHGAVSKSLGINGSYTIPAGYHNGSGKVTQSITTKAAATYTPTTSNQTIAAGQYLSGAQTIKGDANLIPANIKNGVKIFGVTGTASSTSAIPENWKVAISNIYYTADQQSLNSCSGQYIYFEGMSNPLLAVSWKCNYSGMVMNSGFKQPNSDTAVTLNGSERYWFRVIEWDGTSEKKSYWYNSTATYLAYNTGAIIYLSNGVHFWLKLNTAFNTIQVMNETINSSLSAKVSIIVYKM